MAEEKKFKNHEEKKADQQEKRLHQMKKIDEQSGGELFKKMQELAKAEKQFAEWGAKRNALKQEVSDLLNGRFKPVKKDG